MNSVPLQCNVCNKQFTGSEPAQQHYQSAMHKKKMENEQRAHTETGHWCRICHLKCDTEEQLKRHIESPRHINEEEKSQLFNSISNDGGATSPGQVHRNIEARPLKLDPTVALQQVPQSNNSEDYVFNGDTGFCNVCSLQLTSRAHTEQHINGQKHQKKCSSVKTNISSDWETNLNLGNRYPIQSQMSGCGEQQQEFARIYNPCFISAEKNTEPPSFNTYPFQSRRNIIDSMNRNDANFSHVSDDAKEAAATSLSSDFGSKYVANRDGQVDFSIHPPKNCSVNKINEEKTGLMKSNELPEQQRAVDTPPDAVCDVLEAALNSSSWEHNNRHQTSGMRHILPSSPEGYRLPESEEVKFDGLQGYCYVCSIALTSQQHAEQHLSGIKHAKAKSHFSPADSGKKNLLSQTHAQPTSENICMEYSFDGLQGFCYVCSVTLTSSQLASQHLSGSKHKKANEKWSDQQKGFQYSLQCDTYQKDFTGPETAIQHYERQRAMRGLPLGTVSGDNTFWYICDICHCNVNSKEQLDKHKQSHRVEGEKLKHVEQQLPASENGTSGYKQEFFSTGVAAEPLITRQNSSLRNATEFSINNLFGGIKHNPSPTQIHNTTDTSESRCSPHGTVKLKKEESNVFPIQCTSLSGTSLDNNQEQITAANGNMFSGGPAALFQPQYSVDEDAVSSVKYVTADYVPTTRVDVNTSKPMPLQPVLEQSVGDKNCSDLLKASDCVRNQYPQDSNEEEFYSREDNSLMQLKKINTCSSSEVVSAITRSYDAMHIGAVSDTRGYVQSSTLSVQDAHGSGSSFKISPFPHFKYHCFTCNRPMDTKKAYVDHVRGKYHGQKVTKEVGPVRNHSQLVKNKQCDVDGMCDKTITLPRKYQNELYSKAMTGDKLIFLPTGTGKTLVSAMVIKTMLELNPSRQVLFLVDRVLLVLQQAEYLKKEIGEQPMNRFNIESEDGSGIVNRPLLFATLCGGKQNTGGVPLWKHDVIIITAAFCVNLLNENILRWEDMCLIVFDEAHHCQKNHPFNKLLQTYHCKCESKPKLLGLTASPAGKDTVNKTVVMLQELLFNLNGAKIGCVEKNQRELKIFQSNAECSINSIHCNAEETKLKIILQNYLVHCYARLSIYTDIKERCDIELQLLNNGNILDEDISNCAALLTGESYVLFRESLDMLVVNEKHAEIKSLCQHIKVVCMTHNVLMEIGLDYACEIVAEAFHEDGISIAKQFDLPFKQVINFMKEFNQSVSEHNQESTDILSSHLGSLIKLLVNPSIDWQSKKGHPMCLVLVKERKTAHSLSEFLKNNETVKHHRLNVACIVGHGDGSASDGMRVNHQKRVLEEIKNYDHNIIVATSVAEEGVDFPECELVITMYTPDTVTALVQMRGRARKKNSKFVIMCTEVGQEKNLTELLHQENNMIEAITKLLETSVPT